MVDATIIIAAWCAEASLAHAVRSALAQNDVSVEVIVIDDASPDGTFALAQNLAAQDGRVRALRQSRNGGPAAARNAGLAAAQGRWVAVLDADDAMAPGRLASMIALGEAKGADAIYDDFQPVDGAGHAAGPTHLASLRLTEPVCWDLETFLAGCQAEQGKPGLGYLKPLIRIEFMKRHGVRYDETLRNGEDFHLIAAVLAAGGALWVLPKAGYLYTRASGTISSRLNPDHATALARADAAFLDQHAQRLSPEARRLLRRHMRRFLDFGTTEAVLHALRAGRLAAAAAALLRRPQAAGRLLRQVAEAMTRRIRPAR
ncbi:glycosyltransferase [Citreicella sp. C3M06]|uniref:glycosyltransferase family 2 protein n=1 Tax=Citreicella sp. C3M06 TaxID=2841564 RepID=UPI001C07EF60|nr:glycosyltransferase family 2 protein [Citreicella sp. C3M06]MBU2960332.1 glycosyltransferase [Citreicella sp. C3M06]